MLGSPVNRIKITGFSASAALTRSPNLTFPQRLREYAHHLTFLFVIYSMDVAFWASRMRQYMRLKLMKWGVGSRLWSIGEGEEGFEDELERGMRDMARSFGVKTDRGMFDG